MLSCILMAAVGQTLHIVFLQMMSSLLTAAIDGDTAVTAGMGTAGHVKRSTGAVYLVVAVTRHAVTLVAILLTAVSPA